MTNRPRALCTLVLLSVVLSSIVTAGWGQPAAAQSADTSARSLERQIYESFERQRYRTALELIDEYLERWPNRPNMQYNKACAHALIGERDSAAEALRGAIEAGFTSFDHMQRDPDLDSIRDHPTYLAIMDAVRAAQRSDAHRVIGRWRNRFGDDEYTYETDEAHRLCFATALDTVAHAEMRTMLQRQADHLSATLFDGMPDYYVLVAVPTPEHVDELLKGDTSVGGLYDHNQRVLVTRNIGGSLRHEYFHVMHYGHMDRLGQDHPLWIQEGMASLYEDYDLRSDGTIRYLPNERHNVTLGLARGGGLMPWDRILQIDNERFMRHATKLYPQVRSMFEFFAARGKLQQWYHEYVRSYDDDPTGRVALEKVFREPLDDVERQWRRWVHDRPAIDMYIRDGDAALGIIGEPQATNDGVMISQIMDGSSAANSSLREGDVIVAVDGTSTRSLKELQSIIGNRSPGDVVVVRARRGSKYFSTQMTLKPLRQQRPMRR